MSLCGVLDQGQAMTVGDLAQPVVIGGQTIEIDGDDRAGAVRYPLLDQAGVDVERLDVGVDKQGLRI